jgi:hypothetical protein
MTDVSPKAITPAERRWMGRTPEEYDALQVRLMADGVAGETAMRLIRHLDLLNRNPRLAIDSSSGEARWRWRRILAAYKPPPRPRRREAGQLQIATAAGVATAAGAAATGHSTVAAALFASLVITRTDGDELLAAA